MQIFRAFFALLAISSLTLISCEKVIETQPDSLEQEGVLGQWKLEYYEINGISDLSVRCCDYIEFKADSEPSDLNGTFTATGAWYETNGVFEINLSNNTIQFDYEDTQKLYGFQISDNVFTFTYTENNAQIIELWRKEN